MDIIGLLVAVQELINIRDVHIVQDVKQYQEKTICIHYTQK